MKTSIPLLASLLLTSLSVQAQPAAAPLIRNGSFAEGGKYWRFTANGNSPSGQRFEPLAQGGGQWAVIETRREAKVGFSWIEQSLARVPRSPVKFSLLAASAHIEGGNGAYAYLEFRNAEGQRISGLQTDFAPNSDNSARLVLAGDVPTNTAQAVLRLILHGRGTARFTDVSLAEMTKTGQDFATRVSLKVSSQPAGGAFFGLGAEDDGWAYTKGNAAKGWSEEDSALREKRLRWLKPSFVRSFIWTHDWLPASFWTGEGYAYLFEGDLFQSKLRTWRLYRELGTAVMLAQVSWEQGGSWRIPERHIAAIGDLFAHLHGEHALCNVKYYSVDNEPNHSLYAHGGSFEIYTRYHEGLAAEFAKRNLQVGLVGSDDGNGMEWFRHCVETPAIRSNAAFFASHKYIPYPMLNPEAVDGVFNSRMEFLEDQGVDKPFLMTEFGFTGAGTSHYKNPYMSEPDYALASMAFVLRGLNRGVRGFCFWTMHEMVYPPYRDKPTSHHNQIMTWALWDFKGNLKPVYHAAALMMREMRPNMPVHPVKSDAPGTVQATRVGDKIFWVNLAPHPVEIAVEGLQPKRTGIILAEEPLADFVEFSRSADVTPSANGARFTAPSRSYGMAE